MKEPASSDYYLSGEYFRRRFALLIFPSFLINLYYALFLFVVYYYRLFAFQTFSLSVAIAVQLTILLMLQAIGFAALARLPGPFNLNKVLGWLLIVCTFLVIMSGTVPVYFWGGSPRSVFTPLMLTECVIVIMVTRSFRLKAFFLCVAQLCFVFFGFWYNEIDVNPQIVVGKLTGTQLYRLLYLLSVIISLSITLYISSRTSTEIFTAFDEDEMED